MSDEIIIIQKELEKIRRVEQDIEYWTARDLMPMLGYKKWSTFLKAIDRAKSSCENSSQNVLDHFAGAGKMVVLGSGSQREIEDFLLTRYACYLIAQNGDPRKPEIAFAQTYFAIQTRRQEINEQRIEEDKRLEARYKLKETEETIEQTVYERGIKLPIEFATFKNKHIKALYGGIDAIDLKIKRNIPKHRALADFDSHVELRAKDFALAMTDHNIREKNLVGIPKLESEVMANSHATRKTLIERGIKPENLRPEEDIKKIENRRKKIEKLQNSTNKYLTEKL